MRYTVINMEHKMEYVDENKKKISLNGYAFLDENEKCFIIVYGESKRDGLLKYL